MFSKFFSIVCRYCMYQITTFIILLSLSTKFRCKVPFLCFSSHIQRYIVSWETIAKPSTLLLPFICSGLYPSSNRDMTVAFISFVNTTLRPRNFIRVSYLLYLFYSCLLVTSKKCHIFAIGLNVSSLQLISVGGLTE